MQQQRDALLIICIPCIDSEREGGGGAASESKKQCDHLQLLLDNVLEGWGWVGRLFEVEDKKEKGWESSNTHEANSVQSDGKTAMAWSS